MFFILSKTLNYLTQPIVIVCVLFLLSVTIRKQSWRKRFFWSGFVLLFFFTNDFIANEVMSAWELKPTAFASIEKKYEYGILLTGVTITTRQPDDRVYFDKGADRVVHSVQLYKLGFIKKILVSGGNGSLAEVEIKEADDLKRALLIMGVNEQDIVLENTSRNTHESAVETKKLLSEGTSPQDCLLITSAFHMRRSLACFRHEGLDMDSFSTDYYTHPRSFTPDVLLIPKADALRLWQKLFKEWTGFIAYKITGYI